VATPGAKPEIWAYGLRNPWRFSFDSESGALWLADVGQNALEEIDIVVRGANYGWNTMEGRHCFERATCDQSGLTLPVAEYTHDFGCSVTGGYEYHGARAPWLEGAYIYADFCSGRVWAVRADRAEPIQIAHEDFRVSSFGVDVDDELYVVSLNGRLFRFAADPDASAPTATATALVTPAPTPGVSDDGDAITLWVIGLIVALAVGVLGLVLRMSPLF
jgi:glucose/arabinose dehydrogenase